MVVSSGTEGLISFASAPAASQAELEIVVHEAPPSALPSICVLILVVLVEIAWFSLLLFLARVLILG